MSSKRIPDLQSSLGDRLKEERGRLGLTQEGLAKRIDVTARSIAGYELGTTTIRLDILYRLAEAGIDIPYVLFGDAIEISSIDQALYTRVCEWADVACRDRRGKPVPEWERQQRIVRAYRWLASSKSEEEREERFAQLPPSRVA